MTGPTGAFAPIPTPVGDDGRLDLPALGRHLGFLSSNGLDGALVLGTNGEFPSFDIGERRAMAEAASRTAGGLSLMLGVGSCALPEVVELVGSAHLLGYGSVLVPPPFYFRGAPVEGLTRFFLAVCDAAELPVLLYHIPQVTGIEISDHLLESVAEHPRFGGVKDSSGSRDELARFTGRLENHSYMVGSDRLITAARDAGGAGSITAAASVVPSLVAATHRDPRRQPDLDAVRALLESHGLGPAVKTILRHMKIGPYRTRPPLLDLDDDRARELVTEFEGLACEK